MDLSISIPRSAMKITGYMDLNEGLSEFIKSEKLDGTGYKCEKCKKDKNLVK
jgi:ubiquitin C-terminal hydrolase